MKRSLVQALFLNDRIKTVESRAKEIRPDVDKIITWAKKGDLHSRRLAIAALGNDKELVREIFEKVEQGMFADRQGGYTRIMKLGFRKGDNAPMVIMELCTEPVSKKTKTEEKPAAKKAAPKKVEAAEEAKAEEKAEEAAPAEEAAAEGCSCRGEGRGEGRVAFHASSFERAEALPRLSFSASRPRDLTLSLRALVRLYCAMRAFSCEDISFRASPFRQVEIRA